MILALDLGTITGFAAKFGPKNIVSGLWNFKPQRFEGGGNRYLRFAGKLREMHEATPIARVFFEEVRRHLGVDAAHVYGGLMGMLTAFCEERSIPYEGVPVGTIKAFWTGKGNAPKEKMVEVAQAHGFKQVTDHNEADALAILYWAVSNRGD